MPENTASVLVSRAEFQSFMNTGTAETPEYNLIGEGFTDFSEAKNPKEYSRQYVHEKTERTDVVGYATSFAYSFDTYTNNPVITKLRKVHDEELIGTDAQVDIVGVNLFEGTEGSRTAFQRRFAIIPDAKGSGVEALVYSGTLKAVGDIKKGTFNESTKTFTASGATENT